MLTNYAKQQLLTFLQTDVKQLAQEHDFLGASPTDANLKLAEQAQKDWLAKLEKMIEMIQADDNEECLMEFTHDNVQYAIPPAEWLDGEIVLLPDGRYLRREGDIIHQAKLFVAPQKFYRAKIVK